jgi:hypothetical protein
MIVILKLPTATIEEPPTKKSTEGEFCPIFEIYLADRTLLFISCIHRSS